MKVLFKSALFFVLVHGTCFAQVGIGTTSPVNKFEVETAAAAPLTSGVGFNGNLRLGATGANQVLDFGLGTTYGWIQSRAKTAYGTNYNLLLNPNGGRVGVGTNDPQSIFHVKNGYMRLEYSFGPYLDFMHSSGSTDQKIRRIGIYNGDMIFDKMNDAYTTSNEQMRITSTGNVGIGTTNPSEKLEVVGVIRCSTLVQLSDMRFKNISETISSDDSISTIRYEWKDGRDDRVHIGYGAQEVERILPDAVYTDAEGLKAVNYDEVHTYKIMQLEQMVKELQQQNAELKKLISRKRRIRQ